MLEVSLLLMVVGLVLLGRGRWEGWAWLITAWAGLLAFGIVERSWWVVGLAWIGMLAAVLSLLGWLSSRNEAAPTTALPEEAALEEARSGRVRIVRDPDPEEES